MFHEFQTENTTRILKRILGIFEKIVDLWQSLGSPETAEEVQEHQHLTIQLTVCTWLSSIRKFKIFREVSQASEKFRQYGCFESTRNVPGTSGMFEELWTFG